MIKKKKKKKSLLMIKSVEKKFFFQVLFCKWTIFNKLYIQKKYQISWKKIFIKPHLSC